MPLSKYNQAFGGKPGSASEAHASMLKQYGSKKGESVFYATKNKNLKRKVKPKPKRKVRHKEPKGQEIPTA